MRKGANKDSNTSACLPFRAEMNHLSRQYFWNLARFRMLWCCTELYWKVFLIFYLHHLIFIYIIYIQYMKEQKYSEWLACNTTNYILKLCLLCSWINISLLQCLQNFEKEFHRGICRRLHYKICRFLLFQPITVFAWSKEVSSHWAALANLGFLLIKIMRLYTV